MIFVDGLGLGVDDTRTNPLKDGVCPVLAGLLETSSVPIDATLGVPGLPQSATGQTALLTGINAARAVGRHIEGFPNAELRGLIEQNNIFRQLTERGYRSTFANAYYFQDVEEVKQLRRQSVTTVATLSALGTVRDARALLENRAVYQDLTREKLRPRGYEGPLLTPRQSAGHLMALAQEYDFTLFEYFQTDLAAHSGNRETVDAVLGQLDEFMADVRLFGERPGNLLVLTSDHGNIEDLSTRTHTLNPVPLVAVGEGAEELKRNVKTLADFVPALMEGYPMRDHG